MTETSVEHSTRDQDHSLVHLTRRQVLAILVGLSMGLFLTGLDHTIVSTSLRVIADDLRGFSQMALATTSYLISATIAMPICGRLSDIYGRKELYLTSISIFLFGSLACAFAHSIHALAVFRFVQGLGAGGLTALAFAIVADIMPPRAGARYQSYLVSVLVASTALGPVIGGAFAGTEQLAGIDGWRWVFLINLPLGIVAIIVVACALNLPTRRHRHRIDWQGAATLAIGVIPLLLVVEQGSEWGWSSSLSLGSLAAGLIGVGLFVWTEFRTADAALIPVRLFSDPRFSVAMIAGFLLGFVMFSAVMLIPQYFQIARGYTPIHAGLSLLPLTLAVAIATLISGSIIGRTGRYKALPVAGTALMSLGFLLFAQVSWSGPSWLPWLSAVLIGFGLGGSAQTLLMAAQVASPTAHTGVSTASATFVRQIGGAFGVAVAFSILFGTLAENIRAGFAQLGRRAAETDEETVNIAQDSSFLEEMPIEWAQPYLIGFNDSISTVFYILAGIAAFTSVVTMFIRELPLEDRPFG